MEDSYCDPSTSDDPLTSSHTYQTPELGQSYSGKEKEETDEYVMDIDEPNDQTRNRGSDKGKEEEEPDEYVMDIDEPNDQTRNRGSDNGKTTYPWKRNFYKPSLVSIGPKYSKEVDQVKDKEYKKMYLMSFLKRAVEQHEEEYREYLKDPEMKLMDKTQKYYEEIGITYPHNDEELVDMLLLDGCFVVDFVLKCKEGGNGDPRISVDGKKAREDMLLFENQLPFDVLTAIYNKKTGHIAGDVPSFTRLVKYTFASLAPNFTFYNFYDDSEPRQPMDLLHVVYSLCLPKNAGNLCHRLFRGCCRRNEAEGDENRWLTLKHINSATELQEAGVNFNNTGQVYTMPKEYGKIPPSKHRGGISLFDITFSSGVMSIPCFKVDNSTEIFFRNMIALEQQRCQLSPKYYTDYARLMNHLVDTNKDISLLRKNGTIHNLLGEDGKVAYIFNNLSVGVDTSTNFYFASVYKAVDRHYYRYKRKVWRRKLKNKCCYRLGKVTSTLLIGIFLGLLALNENNNSKNHNRFGNFRYPPNYFNSTS